MGTAQGSIDELKLDENLALKGFKATERKGTTGLKQEIIDVEMVVLDSIHEIQKSVMDAHSSGRARLNAVVRASELQYRGWA